MNISAIPTPNKAQGLPGTQQQERSTPQQESRGSYGFYQREADQMVKKQNYNNLGAQGKFVDDDDDLDVLIQEMESQRTSKRSRKTQ